MISLDERHDVVATYPFLDDFIQVDNRFTLRIRVQAFLDFLPLNRRGLELIDANVSPLIHDDQCKCGVR